MASGFLLLFMDEGERMSHPLSVKAAQPPDLH